MVRPWFLTSALSAVVGLSMAATALPASAQPDVDAARSSAPALADGITHDENPGVPEGASWTEHYFSAPRMGSPTKVKLHADVLRPEDLPPTARTPVILSVGPYFNHSGQTGRETDTYQPSSRFDDFIDGAQLMDRGYTVVLVDNRGFGGSTGCLDWVGPGEQADIVAAVEWAASRRWSTGKVGMYGKSYDAVTGLWGADLEPDGLEAVVAQEPLWDMYPYLYSNDVPRYNRTGTPRAYNSIASLGGTSGDSDRYKRAAAYEQRHPECLIRNSHDTYVNTSASDRYWRLRNHAVLAEGSTTPVFFTQGFTESNTKPEETELYLRNHIGPERGWMGPWEHVRGNEVDPVTGTLSQGRAGFFDEVMRFYDQYLKGIEPSVEDPAFAIQDNFGRWRAQDTWPVVEDRALIGLGSGRYIDSGPVGDRAVQQGASPNGKGLTSAQARLVEERQVPPKVTRGGNGDMEQPVHTSLGTAAERKASALAEAATVPTSFQKWSRPVAERTRLTGTPRIVLNTRGQGEVYVALWDVDPKARTATLINENVAELNRSGRTFDLKGMDWTLRKRHRLVVEIGTITFGSWNSVPSGRVVRVNDAQLLLSTQSTDDDVRTQGDPSPWLDRYLEDNTIPSGKLRRGTFTVPTP